MCLIVLCRHPSGPSAAHLRREAAGGRAHHGRLQHPEGVDAAPGAPPQRRRQGRQLSQERRAQPPPARAQVPPAQDDLPRVLRTQSHQDQQLPQEEVRPLQRAEAKEEAGLQELRRNEMRPEGDQPKRH